MAGWQRTGQPLQVPQLEWQQDEVDSMFHIHSTLWVQEVMRCPVPNILLKTSSHCLVHSKQEAEVRLLRTEAVYLHSSVCNLGHTNRIMKLCESINLPSPDPRRLPELPTTAHLRQRVCTGPVSTVGGEITWNIFSITSSKLWSLPDRWRPCRKK